MLKKILFHLQIIFIPCAENKYKPRFLESKFLLYYCFALLILKLITFSFILCFQQTAFFADLSRGAIIFLTNQERESLGLNELEENPILVKAASQKAQDMLENDYFSHESPEGITPWYWFEKAGYSYQSAGENLAIGFLDSEEVVRAWENSPSHRANLLNPEYKEVGIAVATGDFNGSEVAVVVQLFGNPSGKDIKPVMEEPEQTKQTETEQKEEKEIVETAHTKETTGQEVAAGIKENEFKLVSAQTYVKEESLAFKFFKFMSLDYPGIVQNIIFYSLMIITLSLILNIVVKINIQDKRLILKTAVFIALLILFIYSDKELMIQLIPHNLIV